MSEPLRLVPALLAGLGIGGCFFGGLWLTVRNVSSAKRPALWFLGSLLLRTGIALAGFYFVAGGEWDRLVLCLLGFVCAQIAVTRLTRASTERRSGPEPQASHAP